MSYRGALGLTERATSAPTLAKGARPNSRRPVLTIPNFNPYALGPYHPFGWTIGIRWYALAYITGIALGWIYAARLIKTERLWGARGAPVQTRQLDDLVLWLTMGVILGGRFGY